MKRFALVVKYGTGEVCKECDSDDIIKELSTFKKDLIDRMGGTGDKGGYLPFIKEAKILPLWYESKYSEEGE